MKLLPFIILFILVLACGEQKPDNTGEEARPVTISNAQQHLHGVQLFINKKHIKLLSHPSLDGTLIKNLQLGEIIHHTGNISKHTTAMRLQGKNYDEPWLEVRSKSGQQGWVYAGGIEFDADNEQSLQIALTTIRLQQLFGKNLSKAIYDYQRTFNAVRTARQFEKCYLNGEKLRDQLVAQLTLVEENSDAAIPDLFWLNDLIPGFVLQLVEDGASYTIYADYKEWERKARTTTESIDDDFIRLCLQINPSDGIEYDYKSWFIQTWAHGGSSLLGRGIHLSTLVKMDSLRSESHLFEPYYQKTKAILLEDIVEPSNSYWEAEDVILAELDSLIALDLSFINEQELIALQARREMFLDTEAHQIATNQKAGEY